jgi:predicted nucleic acid-binding protein
MSGKSLFLDTNIVLYLLSGDIDVKEFLDQRPVYIYFITELELLRYKTLSTKEEQSIRDFLASATILDINSAIKTIAVELGRQYKTKLPDLIVASSAYYLNFPLLTADKQFAQIEELEVLLFER